MIGPMTADVMMSLDCSGAAALAVLPMSAGGTLPREEQELARAMAPERQHEFTIGRLAAHGALAAVGGPATAVLIGAAGEPLWPTAWVGSISHSRHHAAALVVSKRRVRSVGLDIVDERALDDRAAANLMTVPEVKRLIDAGWARDAESARRLVFSAKEAVFKCQYPLTGCASLDFLDVTLCRTRDAAGADRITASCPAWAQGEPPVMIEVFLRVLQGVVLALAVARADGEGRLLFGQDRL